MTFRQLLRYLKAVHAQKSMSSEVCYATQGLQDLNYCGVPFIVYCYHLLEENRLSDVRNIVLVVAILIATATYQTGLSPPGGIWQDDYHPSKNTTTATSTNTHFHINNKQ